MYNFLPQEKFSSLYSVNDFIWKILLTYFVSQYHCISLSLTSTFLSNYTLVGSSTQMPIRYCVVPLPPPQPNFVFLHYICAINSNVLPVLPSLNT
jgi:hypothetical protein